MKHKKLTLIELIITIMVLGLLAALAIPQFTGVKANADVASFKNDIDTLAKAMDESFIKDDNLPLGEKVTVTDPALLDAIYATGDSGTDLYKIDLSKSSKYHSKLKTKVTATDYFIYSKETGFVFFTKGQKDGEGKTLYTLDYIGLLGAKLGSNPLVNGMNVPLTEPTQTITGQIPVTAQATVELNGTNIPVTYEDVAFEGNVNLLAASQMKKFTAQITLTGEKNVLTVKIGNSVSNFNVYLGGSTQPTTEGTTEATTEATTEEVFDDPVAVITMTPNADIYTDTVINWSYSNSTVSEGLNITETEWEGVQTVYDTVGTYTVRVRVKDSRDTWSQWTEITFSVLKAPLKNDENNFNVNVQEQTAEEISKLFVTSGASGGSVSFTPSGVEMNSGSYASGSYITTTTANPLNAVGTIEIDYDITYQNKYYGGASAGAYVFINNYDEYKKGKIFPVYNQVISQGVYFQTYGGAPQHIGNVIASDHPWSIYPGESSATYHQLFAPSNVPVLKLNTVIHYNIVLNLDTGDFIYKQDSTIISSGRINTAYMDKLGDKFVVTFANGNYSNQKSTYQNISIKTGTAE